MKMKLAKPVLLACLALSGVNALACYTVYDRGNAVVYNAMTPPVDMTPPYIARLNKVFPGSHLVFGSSTGCPEKQAGYNPLRQQGEAAPLFTDAQTAEQMKLEHTVLPGGAALVRKPPANMRPGFNVINLGGTDSPGRSANAAPKPGPVITEMRDPPMTVIQEAPGRPALR
ncbi:MAG: hypothetical protein LH479_05600 [Polaromonas sp.]|nr:hypothetical protein [Polaromonas sp.]